MKTKKIQILGIMPYEVMESHLIKIARQRDDLTLTTFVGDLKKGVEFVDKKISNKYDVIISRGGTAEMINEVTNIPVIEIPLSVYDILGAIKLAENYESKFAIVGFPAITRVAHLLCDLLRYDFKICTIQSEVQVTDTLTSLKEDGYSMVLCDMITHTLARRLGLNSILITSGMESIEEALNQAVKLCRSYAQSRQKNLILSETLKNQSTITIILDEDGSVFFSTCKEHQEMIIEHLTSMIDNGPSLITKKTFQLIGSYLYAITATPIEVDDQYLFAFHMEANPALLNHRKHGITYSNHLEIENQLVNHFYSFIPQSMISLFDQITDYSYPIMIVGEEGTDKNQAAAIIYTQSSAHKNPYIIIDCALLNNKSWNFLVDHHDSPFYDSHNTIYISHINELSEVRRKQLLSVIVNLGVCKRNHLILSCTKQARELNCSTSTAFINTLSCICLQLPSLREHLEEISSISSLYLNFLNLELSKKVIGFEPDALNLMRQYNWPYNYIQLKRILRELVLSTSTLYITAEAVENILSKESQCTDNTPSSLITKETTLANIDTNQTLAKINQDIIQVVLEQCNGNQTKAAKKLGISRTTLWRYIK